MYLSIFQYGNDYAMSTTLYFDNSKWSEDSKSYATQGGIIHGLHI